MEQSNSGDTRLRTAHETARALHDALGALGIPETELITLTSRQDAVGRPRIHIPGLSPESTGKLLRALTPALGPEWPTRLRSLPGSPATQREAS